MSRPNNDGITPDDEHIQQMASQLISLKKKYLGKSIPKDDLQRADRLFRELSQALHATMKGTIAYLTQEEVRQGIYVKEVNL